MKAIAPLVGGHAKDAWTMKVSMSALAAVAAGGARKTRMTMLWSPRAAAEPFPLARASTHAWPAKQSTLDARWRSAWEPRALLVRDAPRLRAIFDARLRALSIANVTWDSILRGDLDSPFRAEPDFSKRLARAIERRVVTKRRKRNYKRKGESQ